jgi:acyl-coenzyme A thioesterase PaaI-like protein
MGTWPKVDLDTFKEYKMCFGCGKSNPIGLKLSFAWDGKVASAEFIPNENHQGWSKYVHGGILFCLLDEAMGWAAVYSGTNNVTARFSARLKRMVQVGEPLIITCWVSRSTKKLLETEAKIELKDGTVIAEGKSTQFVVSLRGEAAE